MSLLERIHFRRLTPEQVKAAKYDLGQIAAGSSYGVYEEGTAATIASQDPGVVSAYARGRRIMGVVTGIRLDAKLPDAYVVAKGMLEMRMNGIEEDHER